MEDLTEHMIQNGASKAAFTQVVQPVSTLPAQTLAEAHAHSVFKK